MSDIRPKLKPLVLVGELPSLKGSPPEVLQANVLRRVALRDIRSIFREVCSLMETIAHRSTSRFATRFCDVVERAFGEHREAQWWLHHSGELLEDPILTLGIHRGELYGG